MYFEMVSLNVQFYTMKPILNIFFFVTTVIMFSYCSSAQRLEEQAPFIIEELYTQKWIAGIQSGGSGTDLYLKLKDLKEDIDLDSVYFRSKVAKLETTSDQNLFVGRFTSMSKQDIVLSNEPKAEFGNEAPKLLNKTPFQLKASECVISYRQNSTTRYFKVGGIKEKPTLSYPITPPNKQ